MKVIYAQAYLMRNGVYGAVDIDTTPDKLLAMTVTLRAKDKEFAAMMRAAEEGNYAQVKTLIPRLPLVV